MIPLETRLKAAEDEFLCAVAQGANAIITFNERWDALLADVNTAFESRVDNATLTLAHNVALRIAEIADASIELYSACDTLTSELIGQLDSMMSELTLADPPQPNHLAAATQGTCSSLAHCPPFEHKGPVSSKHKRRRLSYDGDNEPRKRKRSFAEASVIETIPTSSSPESSMPSAGVRVDISAVQPKPCVDVSNVARRTRKRRLSDADVSAPSKPSKRLHAGPRLHAVSDSFVSLRSTQAGTIAPIDPLAHVMLLNWSPSVCEPVGPVDIRPLDQLCATVDVPSSDPVARIEACAQSPSWSLDSPSLLSGFDELTTFITSLFDLHVPLGLDSRHHSAAPIEHIAHTPVLASPVTAPSDPETFPQYSDSMSSPASSISYPTTPLHMPSLDFVPAVYCEQPYGLFPETHISSLPDDTQSCPSNPLDSVLVDESREDPSCSTVLHATLSCSFGTGEPQPWLSTLSPLILPCGPIM